MMRLPSSIKTQLAEPLFRNAYALLVNTLGTSLLGLFYWVLAARYYSSKSVGASSAMIATMLLISTVAQLNLGSALTRFLPQARSQSRRLILSAYSSAALLAVVLSLAAAPLLNRITSDWPLDGLGGTLWFALGAAIWSIFSLQDHTLTGLRQAVWVPVENAAFGVLKITLLLLLASWSNRLGIFASWTIPMAVMLLPVNLLIFHRFLPQLSSPGDETQPIHGGKLRRYVAFDYLGSLFSVATTHLLPVMVAAKVGSQANAYFYIAWVVIGTLDLALLNVGSSLTVEGAHDENNLPKLVSALGRRMLVGGSLLLAGIILAAPVLLSIFGRPYALQATGVLRLLALGLLPKAVVTLWISVARVRNQVGRVAIIQGALSAVVLSGSALLITNLGVLGVGIAFVGGHTAAAVVILPFLLRMVARSKTPDTDRQSDRPEKAPEPDTLDVSVVIPARNAADFLRDCLSSVVDSSPREIIVVDGDSTDETAQVARQFGARVLTDGGNGLPVAREMGALAATSPWVALVDSDVVLPHGALANLLNEFRAGGYVGLQAGLDSESEPGYWSKSLAHHHRYGWSKRWFGLAATIFDRRELLKHGFDETFLSGEDIELRWRLRDSGAKTGVSGTTVVIHRFRSGFGFAHKQWVSDGQGFARMIRKRGLKAWWLMGLPLASAFWGGAASLVRFQPHRIPYYICYMVVNYFAIVRQLLSEVPTKPQGVQQAGKDSEATAIRVVF